MSVFSQTVVLLVISNCFMTFAWYGHLRHMGNRAWYVAAVASWLIALFEYLFVALSSGWSPGLQALGTPPGAEAPGLHQALAGTGK